MVTVHARLSACWKFLSFPISSYLIANSCSFIMCGIRRWAAVIIHKAYKFRLYPTKEQQILIRKTIGCSRFVFNHFLTNGISLMRRQGKGWTIALAQPAWLCWKRKRRRFGCRKWTALRFSHPCATLVMPSTAFSKNIPTRHGSRVNATPSSPTQLDGLRAISPS